MNRRDKTPQRSFGTKLSANSPLPPRQTPKKLATVATAAQFVDESVGAAVGRASGRQQIGNGRQKQTKSATIIEARSVEKTVERSQLNSVLKSRSAASYGDGEKTPVAKLLAFSETPVDSFKIYTGTPDSEVSPASTTPSEEKHWSKRAVTAGAHQTEGSFLYSTLDATSPSFAKHSPGKKSWAQAVSDGASPQPKNLLSAYPTQQLRRPVYDTDSRGSSPGSTIASPGFKSPDSTASVAPTPIKHSYHAMPSNFNIASPTGSIISTSTTHTTASTLFAQHNSSLHDIASTMGPLEYAIQFPAGPLPLELEGVIETGDGKSMGCCVARIKQGFNLSTCQYIKSSRSTNAQVTIQPNDLLISLNSISILSRPHTTILSLLEQFKSHPKTIVFRSLDKVWKSQFQPRTMRNVRSGKRVNTAMDVESMERELYSWVETPTKVVDDRVEEAIRRRKARKSGMERVVENADAEATLTTPVKKTPVQMFSPSNVKKISRTTPTPLKTVDPNRLHNTSTAKKKNARKNSETPGKKQLQQIGQVLVGSDAEDQGFERILRLKKEVLNELQSVRLALMEESKSFDAFSGRDSVDNIATLLEAKLAEKQEECSTLQSKFETEVAALKAELRMASDRTLEREQKSIIMQTDLEEERSKTQAIQSMLEETQRSKAHQEKLISSLEEEADHKQKLIKEAEEASDLKSEELHRLRKQINHLESKNKALAMKMQHANSNSAQSVQKSSEREEILLKMVEQQRVDFEKSEASLEERIKTIESQLEQEKCASVSYMSQLSDVVSERDVAIQQLEGVRSTLAEKESALNALELERDGAQAELEETKSRFVEKEAALSAQVDRQIVADEIIKKLQEEVQSHVAANNEKDALIEELKAEIQTLNESVQEQGVVKSILAENLSKHIAASEDGLTKLDEMSKTVDSRLNDFFARIATSEAGCRAAAESLSHASATKDSSLQRAAADTAELESKVVQVAEELEKCLLREQKERAEGASKRDALERALATCEQLKVEKDELSAMFESLQSGSSQRIKELEGHCEAKDAIIKSLESDCAAAVDNLGDIKASHAEQYSAVLREKEQLECRINDLTKQLEVAATTNQDLTKEVECSASIQDQLESKKNECRQLIDQIQMLELEASERSVFSKDRETKLRQSHEELSNLNIEKKRLQSQFEAEQQERRASESVLRDEIKMLKSDVGDLQSQVDSLCSALDESKLQLVKNREEFDLTLNQKDNLMRSLSLKLSLAHEEVSTAKQNIVDLISAHDSEIASLEKSISELEESKIVLQQQLASAEMKCNETNIRLQTALTSLHEKEEKMADLVSEIDEMRSNGIDLAFQVQSIKQEKGALKEAYMSREDLVASELESLRKQLMESCSQIHDLQTESSKLNSEKKALESELNAANDKMQTMSSEHQKAVDALAGRIETTQCEASVSIAQLKANLETAERLLDQGDEDCERLECEMNDINALLESNKAELESTIAERDALQLKLERDTKELNDRVDVLASELRVKEGIVSELEAEKSELSTAILCMKSSLASADYTQSESQSSLNRLETALKEKEAENVQLKAQCEDLSIQANQSKRDVKMLEKIKAEHLDELSLLESTKQVLSNQLNHLEARSKKNTDLFKIEKQELVQSLDSKLAQINALSSQKDDLMATIETLQSVSRSSESRVASLTVEKDKLENQVNDLSRQIQQLECESQNELLEVKQQVQKPLQSEQEEVTMLHAEVNRLTREIEDLKQAHGSNEDSLRRQLLQSLEAREQDASESTALQLELESRIEEQGDLILAKDKDLLSMKSRKVKLEQIIACHKSRIKELEQQCMSDKKSFESRESSLMESIKAKEASVSELTSKRDELQEALDELTERSQAEKDGLVKSLNEQKVLVSKKAELAGIIDELQVSVNSLRGENEHKDREIKALTQYQAELNKTLEAGEAIIMERESTIAALSSSKENLEAVNEQLRAEIKQLIENAHEEKQSFESKLLHMESAEQSLKSTLKDLEQRLFNFKTRARLEKESFDSTRSQSLRDATNLQNSIAAEKIRYQHLKENLTTARLALSEKESELKSLVADKEAVEADARSKHAELESVIKELNHTIDREKTNNRDVSSRLDSLSSLLRIKDEEIDMLKATGKSSQDSLESQLIESKQNLLYHQQSSLETESKLTSRIESLINEVDMLKESKSKISNELVSLKDEARIALERSEYLEKEKESITSDYKNAIDQLSTVQSELQLCQCDLESERASLREVQVSKEELRLKLQEAMGWCDSLRADVGKKEKLLSENESVLRSKLQELISQSELLRAEIAQKDELLQNNESIMRTKLQEVISWNDSLRSEIEKQKVLVSEKEDDVKSSRIEIESVRSSYQGTISQLNEDHRSSMDGLKSELQSCMENLSNEKEAHQVNLAKNEVLRQKLQEAIEWNDSLKSEKDEAASQMESTIDSLTHELKKVQNDLANMTSTKENEIKELNRHQVDLERARDDALQQLKSTTENLVSQQIKFNESIAGKEATISSLSDEKFNLEQALEELQAEAAKLEGEFKQKMQALQSQLETLQSDHQGTLEENRELSSKLHQAIEESNSLSADIDGQESTIISLRSMLHRTHLDVCQLSMELSCTKGATVLCIADVKKGLESLVNDLAQYYEAKEMNYKSIIHELKEVASKQRSKDETESSMESIQQSNQVSELNTIVNEQSRQIKRLASDLALARDELVSAQAEVRCSKEVEASYHADRYLLHQAISVILNSPSAVDNIDDSVSSSTHPYERFLNFVEHELRDLCILHNVRNIVESDTNSSQPELIHDLLQSLKLSAVNAKQQITDLNQTSDSQQIRDFLYDIDEAKRKVINMSNGREEMEKLLIMEQERTSSLEQAVTEMDSKLNAKSKLLSQTEERYSKLQTKFDHASAEIDACQTLAHELKKTIIEKNAEIQTKQNQLFELQYKLDDLTARSTGIDGTQTPIISSNDEINTSMRHDELAEEVTRLEEQILRMNQDATNLSSMHQALVDGLESECQKLTDEIDEARDYICSLEDMQHRLEDDVDSLKRDCETKARINMDLERAIAILKEQKTRVETDNRLITSEVSKLTGAVVSCAPFFGGFSPDMQSPSSWHDNLQYIGRFIHFLHTTREASLNAEANTPITRGRGGSCDRTDMIVEFKEMQNTLKSVLASPRLTPVKQQNSKAEQDDLYFDLVNAVGQLERLSDNFRDCQEQWKSKELQLTSIINDLEVKSHVQIANFEMEQAWRKRLTSLVIENLERRRHCSVLRRAFQTWACQARLRKHLNIVKDMAKELLQTRQKVLLLKSHFTDASS